MSINVEVQLLSGKTAVLEAELDEVVGAFKLRAQTALGVGNGLLVDSEWTRLEALWMYWYRSGVPGCRMEIR